MDQQQLTGTNFAYQLHSFDRFLDDMVRLERSNLEIWAIHNHLYIPELTFAQCREIRRKVHDRQQRIVVLTPESVMYPVNAAASEPWMQHYTQTTLHKAVDICVELEIPTLFLTPGRGLEDEDAGRAFERSAAVLASTAEYAATAGVQCVVETLQRHESNLVYNLQTLCELLDLADHPNLFAVIDTVAAAAAGEHVSDYLTALGDRVRHVHLVDGSPTGHLAWGDGDLPLDEYLSALDAAGYRGYLTAEIFGARYSLDPFAAHQKTISAVLAAMERIAH